MTNPQDVANTVLHILRDPATGPALTLAFATGSYLFKRPLILKKISDERHIDLHYCARQRGNRKLPENRTKRNLGIEPNGRYSNQKTQAVCCNNPKGTKKTSPEHIKLQFDQSTFNRLKSLTGDPRPSAETRSASKHNQKCLCNFCRFVTQDILIALAEQKGLVNRARPALSDLASTT
jgi:hypothetical protein